MSAKKPEPVDIDFNGYAFVIEEDGVAWVRGCDCGANIPDAATAREIAQALFGWAAWREHQDILDEQKEAALAEASQTRRQRYLKFRTGDKP